VRLVDVRRLGRGALQVCAARLRRHALRGGKEALQEGALLCAGRTACMQRPAALTHSPAGTAIRGSQTVAQGGEEVPQSKTFSYHKSLLVRHVSVVTCMLTVTGSQVRNTVHMTLPKREAGLYQRATCCGCCRTRAASLWCRRRCQWSASYSTARLATASWRRPAAQPLRAHTGVLRTGAGQRAEVAAAEPG